MLVGRDVPLAAGRAALDAAISGRGTLLCLTGEAGIGKTSVARAIADAATAAGAVVRWGACWDREGADALGPWLEALRHPGGDACSAIADALARGAYGADEDLDRQRARVFRDVVAALRADAARAPQLVVIDDVHWADTASALLTRALAAHLPAMPVLLVVTYRDDELPGDSPLRQLGGAADVLALEGLGTDDTRQLLAATTGTTATDADVETVRRQTGGNPLFVTQVARLLVSSDSASVSLPTGARDVLVRRLARLSERSHRVLGAASALGHEFSPADVAWLLDDALDDVYGALDEAATARIAMPVDDRPDRWAFAHVLLQRARYDLLAARERAMLHRRACDALRGHAPAATLAHHASLALFEPDDPTPSLLALEAGEDALALLAADDARTSFQRALDAAPRGDRGDDVRGRALLGLGTARLRTGDAAGAADAFLAAADLARARDDPELLARAALGFSAGLNGFEVRLLDDRQTSLLEDAARLLPDAHPLRPWVLARLSVALSFQGVDARRLAIADDAVALARRLGDPAALANALAARCDAIAGPQHVTERLGAATEVIALAQRVRDPRLELLGRRLRVVALIELGDAAGFDAEVVVYERTADQLGDAFYGWYVSLWRAAQAYNCGRLGDATALADVARQVGRSSGSVNAEVLSSVVDLMIDLDRRRDAAAIEFVTMILDSPELSGPNSMPTLFAVYARVGDLDTARAERRRLDARLIAEMPVDAEWLPAMSQLADGAVRIGDRDLVADLYDRLAPHTGIGVLDGIGAALSGAVDRFLAPAAALLGRDADARRHIDVALDFAARFGEHLVALARLDGARALALLGDRDGAGALAAVAAVVLRQEGLDGLAAEADELAGGRAAAPAIDSSAATGELVREGQTWAFTYAGQTVRVRHAKGIADLAVLLASPGRAVHVRELEGVAAALPVGSGRRAEAVLDHTAVEQYRRRLADLEEDLDEADAHGDVARAARLAAERDALVAELSRAFGLGGRARPAPGDPDERLRKAVSARVRASIDRIGEVHPVLASHLRHAVHTGYLCSYEPERPTTWHVVSG